MGWADYQLLRAAADRLFCTYDSGDDWTHTMKVEKVTPLPPDAPAASCTGGRNACPPEDVGGVHTHNELVAVWREHGDTSFVDPQYADWLPQDGDPTEFSASDAPLAIDVEGTSMEDLLARLLRWVGEHTAYLNEAEGSGLEPNTLAAAVRPWRVLLEWRSPARRGSRSPPQGG